MVETLSNPKSNSKWIKKIVEHNFEHKVWSNIVGNIVKLKILWTSSNTINLSLFAFDFVSIDVSTTLCIRLWFDHPFQIVFDCVLIMFLTKTTVFNNWFRSIKKFLFDQIMWNTIWPLQFSSIKHSVVQIIIDAITGIFHHVQTDELCRRQYSQYSSIGSHNAYLILYMKIKNNLKFF